MLYKDLESFVGGQLGIKYPRPPVEFRGEIQRIQTENGLVHVYFSWLLEIGVNGIKKVPVEPYVFDSRLAQMVPLSKTKVIIDLYGRDDIPIFYRLGHTEDMLEPP